MSYMKSHAKMEKDQRWHWRRSHQCELAINLL